MARALARFGQLTLEEINVGLRRNNKPVFRILRHPFLFSLRACCVGSEHGQFIQLVVEPHALGLPVLSQVHHSFRLIVLTLCL